MPETVLVVDDEAIYRQLLRKLLRAQGFKVLTARDGQSALKRFVKDGPDIVLLDVMMPNQDGFEVCRRLKADPQTRLTPVVLLTALSAIEDRVRGIQAGADDFLTKPVDRSELLARVRSLVSLKAYTDELERAESVLCTLARSIEGKDPYTEGHCERLSKTSAKFGKLVGLPEDQITALRRAGLVHDIGKVA